MPMIASNMRAVNSSPLRVVMIQLVGKSSATTRMRLAASWSLSFCPTSLQARRGNRLRWVTRWSAPSTDQDQKPLRYAAHFFGTQIEPTAAKRRNSFFSRGLTCGMLYGRLVIAAWAGLVAVTVRRQGGETAYTQLKVETKPLITRRTSVTAGL